MAFPVATYFTAAIFSAAICLGQTGFGVEQVNNNLFGQKNRCVSMGEITLSAGSFEPHIAKYQIFYWSAQHAVSVFMTVQRDKHVESVALKFVMVSGLY